MAGQMTEITMFALVHMSSMCLLKVSFDLGGILASG